MAFNRLWHRSFRLSIPPRHLAPPGTRSRALSIQSKAPALERRARRRRIPWRYVAALLSLGTGAAVGTAARLWLTLRTEAPFPGTEEDDVALDALADQIEELHIVKHLRAGEDNSGKGPWVELDIKENMTETATDRDKTIRPFTRRVMGGIQGLGVQRAFWNSETRELFAVVWIGPRLSGWPTVAHGGAIVAMFQDAMSRMIAGPHMPIDNIPTPASLSVTYARPTFTFDLYILRSSFARPDLSKDAPAPEPAPAKSWLPSWKDLTKKPTSTVSEPTMEVNGTLESLDGEIKVRAKGVWPASAVPFQLFDQRRLQIFNIRDQEP
ncbi:hypothetical protein K491DRAFT_716188 [Lophiostoma macrostomum CBS 122681]|uniref:Thioesterase domain-containing protein n=1 Tax=Lophiostoma macrostomum CBS 122681 TaxID=1314788 RepID=A0A6A6T6M2_9PLEO|nr:hypothetical protein K491DRAFT_716188 [Lophiostoma macrostomum CBS 122681]